MEFCQKNSLHMISDEVYGLSVYDTSYKDVPTFTSALSLNPENLIDTERLHILYGMSKVSFVVQASGSYLIIHSGLWSSRSPPWELDNTKCSAQESNCSKCQIP